MLRIVLFIATNLAVLAVLGLAIALLGAVGVLPPEVLEARGGLLAFAAIFGFGGSFVSLLVSKRMAKWTTGAQVITRPGTPTEAWLVQTVADLAKKAEIGMPEVAIFDSPEPNAFATGWQRDASLVAVSAGLLQHMNRREVEAVLAHEVSHVQNGDMVTLALIQGVLNTFVILAARVIGSLIDHVVFRNERGYGPGYWITTLVAQMLLGVLAAMLVMSFSRWREFRADAGARRFVGAGPMIDALERLRAAANKPALLPESLRAFGIRGGGLRGRRTLATRLFASHPPLAERIARLKTAGS